MTNPQELDGGIDEQDRDQTEEQLGAAVTALLAAHTAEAPWLDLVHAELSGLITQYLQRSALNMAHSGEIPTAEAASVASEAVTGALGDVERHAASWLKIAAEDRAPLGKAPMGLGEAEQAAGIIARTLATYARERVRESVATRLGAVYKTWRTRGDAAVRESHRFLAGKTKLIGKPFEVAGSEIMYPGDPEAPPELVYGCRCHLSYTANPK